MIDNATPTSVGSALDTPRAPPSDQCASRSLLSSFDKQSNDDIATNICPPPLVTQTAPDAASSPERVQDGPPEDPVPPTTSAKDPNQFRLVEATSPIPSTRSDLREPEADNAIDEIMSRPPPSLFLHVTPTEPTAGYHSPFSSPVATMSTTTATPLNKSVMVSTQTDTPIATSTSCTPPSLKNIVATAHHGQLLAQAFQAISASFKHSRLNTDSGAVGHQTGTSRHHARSLEARRVNQRHGCKGHQHL